MCVQSYCKTQIFVFTNFLSKYCQRAFATSIFYEYVTCQNKAYRPNAHLFDIIMQLKYQFAIRIRFRISIKRLLVVLPVYL